MLVLTVPCRQRFFFSWGDMDNSKQSTMFDITSHSCGIVVHARIALFIEVYPALVVRSGVRPAIGRWVVVVVTFVVPMRCLTVVSGHSGSWC